MRRPPSLHWLLLPFLLVAGGAAFLPAAERDTPVDETAGAHELFEERRYRSCLDALERQRDADGDLPPELALLHDRATLGLAITRDDHEAMLEAQRALLDRLDEGELDDAKARVAVDLAELSPGQLADERARPFLNRVQRHWETHPEPERVLPDYVRLFEAGLRSVAPARYAPVLDLEAMWRNLVRFPASDDTLRQLGAQALLGVPYRSAPVPERYAPRTWPDLSATGRPPRIVLNGPTEFAARVARDLLRLDVAPWLQIDARLVLGLEAQSRERYAEAVAHFETVLEMAREGADFLAARNTARQHLDEIRTPRADVRGPDRYRPGSAHVVELSWRNAAGWTFTVERLDPREDLRVPDAEPVRVPDSWRELATFYAAAEGEEVFRREREDRVERAARPGGAEAHRPRSDRLWIDALEPGLYRMRLATRGFADEAGTRDDLVIAVTDLGLQAQVAGDVLEGDSTLEAWVADVARGRAVGGAELTVLSLRRGQDEEEPRRPRFEWVRHDGRSDGEGRLRLPLPERGSTAEHVVFGEKDGRPVVGFLRGLHPWTGATDEPRLGGLVWSDRPLYRPGETIHLQAFARWMDDARREIAVPDGQSFTLTLRDPQGQSVFERQVVLDENGSAEHSYSLPARPDLGSYSVELRHPGRNAVLRTTLRVEEVRLPEFEVSVDLQAPPRAVLGDTLRVAVRAEYLFGGPVAGEAEILLKRRPRWHVWRPVPLSGSLVPRSEAHDLRIWPGPAPEREILRRTVALDEKGRAEIAYPTESDEGENWEYVAVARVTDLSRRSESSQARRALGPSALVAYLHTRQAIVAPDDLARFTLRVEDLSGQGVLHRGVWTLERSREGEPRTVQTDSVVTGADGLAEITFRVEDEGHYRLRYRSDDGRGHEMEATSDLWCADPGTRDIVHRRDGLQLVAEAEPVLGDVARVLLISDVAGVDVWLTRAFAGAATTEVVEMSGTVRLLEIPVDDRHRPGFELRAVGAHDFRWREARLSVQTPRRERRLDLSLRFDGESHRPGRLASLEILARDLDGNPVETVVSLAVVDRAVLTLVERPPLDLVGAFHRFLDPRLPAPRTAQGRFDAYADLDPEDEEIGDDDLGLRRQREPLGLSKALSRGGRNAEMAMDVAAQRPPVAPTAAAPTAAVEVRRDFRPTALWRTGIRTGADGRAQVDVPLPSSLTTWEALALAVDPRTRVGQAEASTRTRLPVMVRLQHPRVLREGDRVRLVGVVHNETDEEVEALVQLDAGVLETAEGSRRVLVAAHAQSRVEWTAAVPEGSAALEFRRDEDGRVLGVVPSETTLELTVRTRLGDDAMARPVPLLPRGTPLRVVTRAVLEPEAGAGIVDDPRPTARAQLRFELPAQRAEHAERALLHVAPSVLASCIQALPWLADYPYGCTEQTLSRFVPAVAVRAAAGALGLPAERIDPDLDEKIADGIDRIGELQRGSGAWGWWKEGPENPYMTAYAVRSLSVAHEHGVEGAAALLQEGVPALLRMLPSIENPDDQAYALAALSKAAVVLRGAEVWSPSDLEARLLDDLFDRRDRIRPYARALLALAEHRRGRDDRGRDYLRHLENNQVPGPEATVHWGRARPADRGEGAVEATAFALEAYLALDPDRPVREGAVRWLMLNREGRRWTSTRSTAHAVLALAEHARAEGQGESLESEIVLRHGGREVGRLALDVDALLSDRLRLVVPSEILADGDNRLDVELVGAGPVFLALEVNGFTRQENIEAAGDRLHVEREVVELDPVRTLGGSVIAVEEALPQDTTLTGRRLRVRLKLRVDHDLDFVMIEDPRPAGAEPLERLSGWHQGGELSCRREVRREQNTFFVDHLPAGEHLLEYEIVAESPGRYRIEPTRASGMYLPTWAGHSAHGSLIIREEKTTTGND